MAICAGFSYAIVTAHNGCLQMEVTVHGKMAHAAIPDTGVSVGSGAPTRIRRRERFLTRTLPTR